MIQTTLFFVLGFLSAGFLALMVAPAIWRRAVVLTRKRVEASVPLSMDEIQADKDHMRAEFAMATRRLEMSVKELKDKTASQAVEINRKREELKRVAEERDEKGRVLAELETRGGDTRKELGQRDEELKRLSERLEEAEAKLEESAAERERLGRMYDEASFDASSRQIDMVAQETRLDQTTSELVALRKERKETEQRMREAAGESKAARESQRAAEKKVADLEKKIERHMVSLSDRDEKLERRENEIARLRADLEQYRKSGAGDQAGDQDGTAMLREQIHELAAEVVRMTAMLDKPDSPIHVALAQPATSAKPKGEDKIVSLADRVRALRKAAAE